MNTTVIPQPAPQSEDAIRVIRFLQRTENPATVVVAKAKLTAAELLGFVPAKKGES